jgi:hypothetical protein
MRQMTTVSAGQSPRRLDVFMSTQTAHLSRASPMLHAAVLGFVHPATREYAEHRAPVPADMARAVAGRRSNSSCGSTLQ